MIKQTILDNGIRIITEQIPVAHSVSIGAWVATGSRHEDAALCGISHFAEHMFFKGTGHRSARMIAREIDAVGGMLNAFTSHEFCCYYAKTLAHNLPLATDIISDILLNSLFALDEIEKERRVILNEIAMVEDTPDDQVHDLFGQLFWQGNALARPILGSRETVDNFDRDTLLNFVANRYCGENLLVTAAGNLEHQRVVDHVASEFLPFRRRVGFQSSLPRIIAAVSMFAARISNRCTSASEPGPCHRTTPTVFPFIT